MMFKPDTSVDVVVNYTNYRGVRELRTITPIQVEWTRTEHHPEPGWMLLCWCHRAVALRAFAMKDIHSWEVKT